MADATYQLELPGIPADVPERSVRERSQLASWLYAKATANFERYAASVNAGIPDPEAGQRWLDYRNRADLIMNGKA